MAAPAVRSAQITQFDQGVLSVETLDSFKQISLPITGRITPSDDTIESFIQRIFELPTVRQQLIRELKPSISSRKVLSPNVYYNIADGMEKWFKAMAESTDTPELKDLFDKAEAFFKEETFLRDMLSEFLLALQQG